jgi:sulfofructose kinase
MKRIVSLGIVTLDRVWEVDAIPARPVKLTAHGFREVGGGMAANAAVTIAALGGRAELWSRVGDDAAGAWLLRDLAARRVETGNVRVVAGAATACSGVLVDQAGERMLGVFRGRGFDDDPSWLLLDRLDGVAAVMADNRWREGAAALFGAAGRRGIPRVLDGDVGEPEALAALAPLADHVLFSADGLVQFSGAAREAGLRRAAAKVAATVGVTLGAEGFLWMEQGNVRHAAAFAVAAKDTTGAGDAFHAAYALAIARGESIESAARFANAAAALKCAKGNGWDGVPTEGEVKDLLGRQS